ncbi:MAG: peptidylprolyl isomerase [Rhodothermaceae bacterium]|nr:peptidylprolyl isomerase [Rhodothermaceae bacterium]
MKTTIKPIRTFTLIALFVSAGIAGCSSSNVGSTAEEMADPSLVASIGDQKLTIEEFESRYARSVGDRDLAAKDSLETYEEFLDRYVDFRLKVLYAQDLGLESDAGINAEINGYRDQLARPYLLEKEIMDPILLDMYEKEKELVDASHILIRAGTASTPEELEAAETKLTAIRDSIVTGGADFGEMAFTHSDDPSARGNRLGSKGRLGFFGSGRMVKGFEDAAYETPVDSVSRVFRTQFGFHILYVHEKRPRYQDLYVSHIATRDGLRGLDDTTTAEQRINDLYKRLQNGEDFKELALNHSEDMESRPSGGQLGKLSYTTPGAEPFREQVFALKNPGDFTEIVQTTYGYHIFYLDEIEPVKTFEESYDRLKNAASRLPRVQRAEDAMADKVLEEVGFTVDTTLVMDILNGLAFNTNGVQNIAADSMAMTVLTLADSAYTFKQLVDYAETASIPFNPDRTVMVNYTIDKYLKDQALDIEAARLESTDAEFGRIMEEFKEGLLLFKLMEDSVWTAAAQDTAGLMAYHSPRADSFWFSDRHRIISFRSRNDSLLLDVQSKVEDMGLLSVINMVNEDTTNTIRVDTTFIAENNNSVFDKAINTAKGEFTAPEFNSGSYIMMVNDGIDKSRQKTFDEARSEVVNAYQAILEAELLERLRARYKVHTNKALLIQAFAEEKKNQSDFVPIDSPMGSMN